MIEMDVEVTGTEGAERTTGSSGHSTRPWGSTKGRVLVNQVYYTFIQTY
jgi:hypothetical protein